MRGEIFNLISFFSGIVSIILAFVSIWLSLYFYRQSNDSYEKMSSLQKETEKNVNNLSILIDRLIDKAFNLIESQQTAINNKFLNSSVGNTEKNDSKDATTAESEVSRKKNKSYTEGKND